MPRVFHTERGAKFGAAESLQFTTMRLQLKSSALRYSSTPQPLTPAFCKAVMVFWYKEA